MARTEMLLTPSMAECVQMALAHDMPEAEGRKFFYHYESNGWKVGKLPMKSVAGAMGGWHERWLERGASPPTNKFQGGFSNGLAVGNGNGALSGADKIIKSDEYRRVLERMKVIANSYDSHNEMRPADRAENMKLRKRRDELRKELGIII